MLEALAYVVMSGEGITKVIGEVGSGKTMLCRMLEEKLPSQVETIYIANPNIAPENILHAIAFEAGFSNQPDNKMELLQLFQNWLLQCHANGRRVVVLIEEAQGMPVATLEEIRLLSNLETGQDKLMQIVLFGQPELDQTLARPEIRQLQDRIAHNFYLSPLTHQQIQDYLNFRVRHAGYHGPDLFDPAVSRQIARASKGLIRRINILADKTLLAAFSAGTTRLAPAHVVIAVRDSRFTDVRRRLSLWTALGGAAAGLAVAGILAWLFWPDSVAIARPLTSPAPVAAQLRPQAAVMPVDEAAPRQPLADDKVADAVLAQQTAAADSIDALLQQAASANLLQQRLMATRRWLTETPGRPQYSIQLMMLKASSADNLNHYLEGLPNTIDLDDIFVYETELGEGPMLGVLYQQFDTREAALERMQHMPAAFQTIEPFLLRSIKGLRNEIADNNS